MSDITAFLAKSFGPGDQNKIKDIENLIGAFEAQGFFCESAERPEIEFVSDKVQQLITAKDVFIGIFTKHHPIYENEEATSDAQSIRSHSIKAWTAPPWLLQESGFALALKKKMILFREEGVELSKLQGDLEYIDFNPSNLAPALIKATAMINGLIAKKQGLSVVKTVVAVESKAAEPMEDQVKSPSESSELLQGESPEVSDSEIWLRLEEASHEKDRLKADELLASLQDKRPANAIRYQAIYLYRRSTGGDATALEDFKNLYEKEPKQWPVALLLARTFEFYGKFEKAVTYLKRAASACEDQTEKRRFILSAVSVLKNAKQVSDAQELLLDLFAQDQSHCTMEALEVLFHLLVDKGDTFEAISIGEMVLDGNPGRQEIRFAVGWHYDAMKQYDLSLRHYRLHCDSEVTASALNNLGLAYKNNDLPIRAAENYRKALDLGSLQSAGNLAGMYANAGFARDANLILNGVIAKDPAAASSVGPTLSWIEDMEETEKNKTGELMSRAVKTQEFLTAFGNGLLEHSFELPKSNWQFPFGEISLSLLEGILSGLAELKDSESSSLKFLSMASLIPSGLSEKIRRYSFQGVISGKTCKFTIREEVIAPPSAEPDKKKRRGYLVFKPDTESARVMEVDGTNWKAVYSIQRVQTDSPMNQ